NNGTGCQRVDVNQSGKGGAAAGNEGGMSANEIADLSNAADNSFTINGSVSRGLDMPQQNDWFGGPGGRPMDGMGGFGGDGMGLGMNGPGGVNGPGGDGAGGFGAGRGGRGGAGGPGRGAPAPRRPPRPPRP